MKGYSTADGMHEVTWFSQCAFHLSILEGALCTLHRP